MSENKKKLPTKTKETPAEFKGIRRVRHEEQLEAQFPIFTNGASSPMPTKGGSLEGRHHKDVRAIKSALRSNRRIHEIIHEMFPYGSKTSNASAATTAGCEKQLSPAFIDWNNLVVDTAIDQHIISEEEAIEHKMFVDETTSEDYAFSQDRKRRMQ